MLLGQTPFLQAFPHMESCATFAMQTRWAVVQRCRPQGPDSSPGHGAHAWSNEGKVGRWLGMIPLMLGVAVHARSWGLITPCAVACAGATQRTRRVRPNACLRS